MKGPIICCVLALGVGTAYAGGKDGSVGVGAEAGINTGLGGFSLNFDAGKFHVGGFLNFQNGPADNDADYSLGARFFFHVHSTAVTDFSIGGNLGFISIDDRGIPLAERNTFMVLEPAVQIRAFIASNVALSFTAGISFAVTDPNTSIDITGQVNAVAGVHYYFFK